MAGDGERRGEGTATSAGAPRPGDDSPQPGGVDAALLRRRALRRFVGLPLLLGYSALLVLAAPVREVRPAFLDPLQEFATSALETLGIRVGHVLMHSTYPTEWRYQSYCMLVRGESSDAPPVGLFPSDGVCPNRGIRPRLPPVERALYRMLRHSWSHFLKSRKGKGLAPGAREAGQRSRAMLGRIGAHFCRRPELAGRDRAQIALAWTAWLASYETGALRHMTFLQYRYRCSDGRFWRLRWNPSDDDAIAFWGSEPWGKAPW